jgi:3-deoxy-D-manno-octulosonic-acid transferase
MRKLFKFHCDCGRAGVLQGTFVLDEGAQERLEKLYGKRINFGEALGKHSEVTVDLEREEITLMTDDQEFLAMAEKLGVDLNQGYNPLDYADYES